MSHQESSSATLAGCLGTFALLLLIGGSFVLLFGFALSCACKVAA